MEMYYDFQISLQMGSKKQVLVTYWLKMFEILK